MDGGEAGAPSRGGGRDRGRDRDKRTDKLTGACRPNTGTPGHAKPDRLAHTTRPDEPATATPSRTCRQRDPRGSTRTRRQTRRDRPGRTQTGPDLYLLTVPYPATNRPQRPTATGFSCLYRPAPHPYSWPSSRPLPASPPRIRFSAYPGRFPAIPLPDWWRGNGHSWRTNRHLWRRAYLSIQHAW